MNFQIAIAKTLDARRQTLAAATRREALPTRSERGLRSFGTGYGSSSGYASEKRYVRDWGNARFRFA